MQALARPLKWPPIFPLEKGLVLWLPFDDRSGSRAYDRSGKGNHGTLYGPTWVAGRRGSALSFDGTDDYVEVPHHSSLMPSQALTLEAWVKPTLANGKLGPILHKVHTGYDGYWLETSGGKLSFVINVWEYPAQKVTGTTVLGNIWRHVAATFDGSTLKVFVDGTLEGTSSWTGTIKSNSNPLRIGYREWSADGNYAYGVIDEVRIYNRALTAAEIKRRYESEMMLTRW